MHTGAYKSDQYGWCVHRGGYWFYVNKNYRISRTQQPPQGSTYVVDERFASQVFLDYVRIVQDAEEELKYPNALWPWTLLETAGRIDILTSILTNYTGGDRKVREASHHKGWKSGVLSQGNEFLPNWKGGRAFIHQHEGREFALCVGSSSSGQRLRSRQFHGGQNESNVYHKDYGVFYAFHGRNLECFLREAHECTWGQAMEEVFRALDKHHTWSHKGFTDTCSSLLDQHETAFARAFHKAIQHEKKVQERSNADELVEAFEQERNLWIEQKSYHEERELVLQEGINTLNMQLSNNSIQISNQAAELQAAKQENSTLRKDITEYRVKLGSLSSGLSSRNVAKDASFPSAPDVLENYGKLSDRITRIYSETVEDADGNVHGPKQARFAQNLNAILRGMWDFAHTRYVGLVKDLCGTSDLASLSTASLNHCDLHCRDHWEYLFMSVMDEVIPIMPGDLISADQVPSSAVNIAALPVMSNLSRILETQETTEGDANSLAGQDSSRAGPGGSQSSNITTTCGPVSHKFLDAINWFLRDDCQAKNTLRRLWKMVVLLFLQRPVMKFHVTGSLEVSYNSKCHIGIDEIPKQGERVIVAFPAILCAPSNVPVSELALEDHDNKSWGILRKGLVDPLATH